MGASKKTRGKTIMDMLQSQLQSQPQSQHPPELQPLPQPYTRSQANMQSRTRSQVNVQAPPPSQPPPQSQAPPIQPRTRSQAQVQAPQPSQPPPQLPLSHPLTRSRAHAEPQPQIQTQPQVSSQPSHVEETQSTQPTGPSGSETTSTRRGRGIAKGLDTWGTGQKLHLEFNELMQPECENESHLATHLGIIARNGEQVPLIYAQWTDVPNDVKDYVWKEVQDNTDAPPEYRSNCLKSVGYLWRRWKSYVKTNYYDIWDTDEDRLAHAPNRVVREQWETLIDYWGTAKRQEISAKNKKNRQMQELNHRTGRTPFAVIRRKMKKAGEKTDRISVLKKTRTPKGGGALNPDTAAVIAEMEERRDVVPEEEQTPEFLDNVFTQVLGPDGHGRVRTYGTGPTPTTIFGKVMGASSLELMQKKIREEVRAEFQSQFDVMLNSSLAAIRDSIRAELLADLQKDKEMSGRNGLSSIGQVHTSASVHLPDDQRDECLGHEDRGEYMDEEE